MKKLLFIYDHAHPEWLEGDGVWSALKLLELEFEITRKNLFDKPEVIFTNVDFVLGWGAFDSAVDKWIQNETIKNLPKGLCLAAYMEPTPTAADYDVIFYETEAQRKFLDEKGVKTKLVHAFGINTDIYKNMNLPKIWDYITVGSFIKHHRYDKLPDKGGSNLVVGEISLSNIQEAFNYVASCILNGWTVSNQVPTTVLAKLYNMSNKAYLPADFGQERAVLEARACNLEVEIEPDNLKLKELLTTPIWDTKYYYEQLKKGIIECL